MSETKPPKDAKSMVVTVGNPSWFPPPVSWGIDVADVLRRLHRLPDGRLVGMWARVEQLRQEQEQAAGEGE